MTHKKEGECVCLLELDKLRMLHEEGKVRQLVVAATFMIDGKPMMLTFAHKPNNDFFLEAIHQLLDEHFGIDVSEK